MDWLSLLEGLVAFIAFTAGSRYLASYHDLVKLSLPKWFRRFLFIIDVKSENIALMALVFQSIVIALLIMYLANIFGFNVLAYFGEFSTVFSTMVRWIFLIIGIPVVLYACICEILHNKQQRE